MSILTNTYEDAGVTSVARTVEIRKTTKDLIELSSFNDAPFGVSIVGSEDDYTLDEAAKFATDIGKAVSEGRSMNGEVDKIRSAMREAREEDAAAAATPCGIDGCDGAGHEANADPSTWTHTVASMSFDDGVIVADIIYEAARGYFVYLCFDTNAEMSPAELRADIALYDGYPAWIRSVADRIDALNGTPTSPSGRVGA